MSTKNDNATRWLITPEQRPGCSAKVFCFPHAGAGASIFAPWARRIRPDIELNGVQLPGREGRITEAPLRHLEDIVALASDAIERTGAKAPLLYGHSFGAIVAFYVAKRLEKRGCAVRHVIASAAPAPDRPRVNPAIHGLSEVEFVRALTRRYDGIPESVLRDDDLMRMFLPVLRADLQVLETYEIKPTQGLACPITALAGSADPGAPAAVMESWRALSGPGFRLREFQGGHFFVRQHQTDVLRIIESAVPSEVSQEVHV